jgi:hypothetical protein
MERKRKEGEEKREQKESKTFVCFSYSKPTKRRKYYFFELRHFHSESNNVLGEKNT